jgi:hypothetical protein
MLSLKSLFQPKLYFYRYPKKVCIEKDKFDRLNEKGVIVTQPHLNSGVFPWHTLGSGKSYFAHRITYFIYILSLFPFRVPLMKQDGHVCSLLRPLNLRSQKVKISWMSFTEKRRRTIGRIVVGRRGVWRRRLQICHWSNWRWRFGRL